MRNRYDLVLVKYLANHTSEKVKKKVIELMFSWTQSLPTEVKINEAYQMLKRQSIVTEDPNYLMKSSISPISQRTKSIFDEDEEKSRVNIHRERINSSNRFHTNEID
jgi:ADP-ribosylation factor-binding protein GGA